MDPFEIQVALWGIYFDELQPCIATDGPIDRFAWIEVTASASYRLECMQLV
jgi:hypothetical protein